MKTLQYFTLLTITTLMFFSISSVQDAEANFIVQIVYFVPKDRTPDPNMGAKMDSLIKEVHQFYTDEMSRHGFDGKTFSYETDANGNAVVHQLIGKYNDAEYVNRNQTGSQEILEQFDTSTSRNILIMVLDYSKQLVCGRGGYGGNYGGGGFAIVPASGDCFSFFTIAHELGHGFGLHHNFRSDAYIMSYGRDANTLSFCSAEFLSISRYFNPGSEGFNFTNGEVQMLSPSFVSPPINIRLRFEVTDPDGLHQVLLMIPQDNLSVVDCKSISGESATVEFVTDELHDTNEVHLVVVDVLGNIAQLPFTVDITNLLPTPGAILIPDANLAAAIRENLDLASDSQITAVDMLGLVTLFGDRKQIKDLTGLEHATNLGSIFLSNNQISDLTSLAGLKQLGMLHLRENKIQDVTPLAGLTKLTWLELGNNQISNITSLAGLTQLTDLHLFNNRISDVNPLVELTGLNNLHLAGNSIKDIHPIAKLTSLEGLFLQENQIIDIMPLTGLEKLKHLSLETNQISDISPISGFTQLTRLPLRNNKISNITPLAGLTQLIFLDLRNNNISDVSPLTELIKLEHLDLIENPIKNREPLLTLLRKNPNVEIFLKSYREPLPVTLSHFRAEKTALGVVLRWTTESEVDNAGFYIYRSQTKDGEFQVVNPKMIKGAGTTGERNNYTWTDTTAKPNTVYYYRIEDVSHAGARQQLVTIRLSGFISARGKLTTRWANLKVHNKSSME